MRRWPVRIEIYLNEKQQQHLKEQAAIAGLSIQSYVRSLIEGHEIKPKPTAEYAAVLKELSAIGNNVNQIARVANSKGYVTKEEIKNLQELQNAIWQKVKGL